MVDSNDSSDSPIEDDPRDLEESILRGLRERDEVLQEAQQPPEDALREERDLAGFREAAVGMADAPHAAGAKGPVGAPTTRVAAWRIVIGVAAAALIVIAIGNWDRQPGGEGVGTDHGGMRTLGDPSGIHLEGDVLRWPANETPSVYIVQVMDSTGEVPMESSTVEVNQVELPPRFRGVEEMDVTIMSKSDAGEEDTRRRRLSRGS